MKKKKLKPLTEAELQKFEEACEKIKAGPWKIEKRFIYEDTYEVVLRLGRKGPTQETLPLQGIAYRTADFIADSRELIPRLLQEVRANRSEVTK